MTSPHTRLALAALTALAVTLGGLEAHADCPEGMVPAGKKKRYCCWPGQVYSNAQRQCIGIPQCPEGTTLRAGTCARPTASDPRKLADIRAFLRLTGAVQLGQQSMLQMLQSYRAVMPQVPDRFWQDFQKELDEETMLSILVPIYDKHLSHDDIKALLTFYRSDAGQRFLAALPDIQRESRHAGQRFGLAISRRLEQRLRAEGYIDIDEGGSGSSGRGDEEDRAPDEGGGE